MEYLKQQIKKINKNLFPIKKRIYILGNQKSGTTIISKLIEQATGLPTLHDFPPKYYEALSLLSGNKINFKQFYKLAKKEFIYNQIIKEPQLTFSFSELKKVHKKSKVVIIIRDPRDNIRSILNRVNLRGDLQNVDISKLDIIEAWKSILYSKNIGVTSSEYIDNLANRWNIIVKIYEQNKNDIILVRYEDFLKNKKGFIEQLCKYLEIKYKYDISKKTEIQYQSKGNRNVAWIDFFGKENLSRINNICKEGISNFNYEK